MRITWRIGGRGGSRGPNLVGDLLGEGCLPDARRAAEQKDQRALGPLVMTPDEVALGGPVTETPRKGRVGHAA